MIGTLRELKPNVGDSVELVELSDGKIPNKGGIWTISRISARSYHTLRGGEEVALSSTAVWRLVNPFWDTATRGPQQANPQGTAILKYKLEGDLTLYVPIKKVLRVEKDQSGTTWVWAIVDLKGKPKKFYFREQLIPALEKFDVFLSDTCKVVGLQHHKGFTYLWLLEDETNEVRRNEEFLAFKTGASMPDNLAATHSYVGFYPIFIQMELGLYVFRPNPKGKEL